MESAGLNSHRAPAWLGSAMFSQCHGPGVADGHPAGSILLLSLWGKFFFFQSPSWKCPSCCDKGLRVGGKKSALCDVLGVHTASRSSRMCRVGKERSCAGLKFASRCSCLWASGIYGLKGLTRQGLPWLWESGGQEIETWLQKAAASRLCQAVGALAEDGSELESQGFSGAGLARLPLTPAPFAGVPAWLPPSWPRVEPAALTHGSVTSESAWWLTAVPSSNTQPQGEPVFQASPWLCFLWQLFLTWYSLPFLSRQCQTSVIRPRNSSSPLPNRLRVMNPLKINAPYQQQNCCCKKTVTHSYWGLMSPSFLAVHLQGLVSH